MTDREKLIPKARKEQHCICCGAIIPDGQNTCPNCLVTVRQTEVDNG